MQKFLNNVVLPWTKQADELQNVFGDIPFQHDAQYTEEFVFALQA